MVGIKGEVWSVSGQKFVKVFVGSRTAPDTADDGDKRQCEVWRASSK